MSLLIYDIVFLIAFALFLSVFLYTKRKGLKREGILILYRTSWGIKLINKIGTKYKKTIHFLSYISVTIGYLLMAGVIYLFGKIVWIYVFNPAIVKAVKVPPIAPLIPYLPQIFKLSFLPNFYFTYWIVILAIVMIFHELAHGVFAKKSGVDIKKTGFGFFPFFFPIFPAAFVEPNEKQVPKKKIFDQLAFLSAGTFANILTAVFFLFIIWGFSALAFTPGGVTYDGYAQATVNMDLITAVNGVPVQNVTYEEMLTLVSEEGLNTIETGYGDFVISKQLLELPGTHAGKNIQLYFDSPAIHAGITGPILAINGEKITNLDMLSEELAKYSPGEEVMLTLNEDDTVTQQSIILGAHPVANDTAWLGIVFFERNTGGIMGKIYSAIVQFREPHTYYEPNWGGFSVWIYDLLWWLILICFSVAFINMLPVGIFDGGRFFYLTLLGITGSKKFAEKSFRFVTFLALFLLVLLMVFWVFGLAF